MKHTLKLIGAVALVGAFAATPASAEFANTLGIGQKSTNLGQSGVASASDYDVFYTNPAGAANITRPTIGVGIKALNTTNLESNEPGFNHKVEDTLIGSEYGYVPSLGAYIPGLLPNVTIGVGFGAPQAFAGDWNTEQATRFEAGTLGAGGAGANGFASYGGTNVELIVGELTPTVGIKVSDSLNVGVSVGFATVKHLFLGIDAFVPADVTNVVAGVPADARAHLTAQTANDVGLPIPPWEFATSPHEASLTLGAQYQLLPGVQVGAVYRTETPTEYEVDLALDLGPFGVNRNRGTLTIEIPRHLQIGATIDVLPNLKISADVKWTNWSKAEGIGSPLVVNIKTAPFPPTTNVLGGAATSLLAAPMNGDDTYSIHVGAQYRLMPNLELQAGYNYDPAVFDEGNLSNIFYSSDRHIYSLGATIELPDSAIFGTSGDWEWTVGGQFIHYEDKTIAAQQSQTNGLGPGALTLTGLPVGSFSGNAAAFDIGGYAWSVGVSGVYKFGAPEEIALK